jgi:pantetheine-phosphate adenylyltransferase
LNGRIAVYPGSFDPMHFGHMDIAQRAAVLFDQLVVAVYCSPNKPLLFTAQERVNLAAAVMAEYPNVQVMAYSGLTVDFVESIGAKVIVRGLRVISDFEMEYQMALTNRQLSPEVDTMCLMTSQEYAFISASVVKEVFLAGGNVSQMVHPLVKKAMSEKVKNLAPGDKIVSTKSLVD